ncbi:MAG TPA: amidohydrolase family protein, partial [Anaerolineales bacterium]|nr:amidohydrolase family protein [Anaerolineales bacterium]
GWDSWLGTLEAGKAADLIVLDANPLDDLRIVADKQHLRLVIKDGRVAACHPGYDLPPAVLAGQLLLI